MAASDSGSPRRPAAGPGLADRLRDLRHLPRGQALARLGYDLKRPVFALPFYRYSLSGQAAATPAVTPSDAWSGDAKAGAALAQGIFAFAGQRIADPTPLWAPPGAGPVWLAELHGFAWLRDLRAAGGDAARRCARELVGAWIDENAGWSAHAWHPLATGRRLANWLGCYEFFAASADVEFRRRLLRSIARQAQHLQRVLPAGLAGAELIATLKGLIYAGCCLPGGESARRRGLDLLRRELRRQILPDGGHIERSPGLQLAVLRDLIDLRAVLRKAATRASGNGQDRQRSDADADVPSELHGAVEAMAPVLRLLQHGDGGLALFNGTVEEEGWQVEMVLQRAASRPRPLVSAPETGFHRLRAGRTVVLVDTGTPPPPGLDGRAHAGTLSLEVSVGRERLIVNCGARLGEAAWERARRATAAHSTLVLEHTNSSEVLSAGLGRRARVDRCAYDEADGSLWLEAGHDGYARGFGMMHRRRVFLAADGADLRGEDRLDPCALHPRGGAFAIRFHLHPQVQVSLAQGGGAALLRLPKGGGWRLRAAGATLSVEPSIYLGRKGEIRRSQQVVLAGEAGPDGARVKWALRRIPGKRAG